MNAPEARTTLLAAWRALLGAEPSPAELQTALAIARHETGWGTYKPFPGSHNWGAVQCCKPDASGQCPPGSFLAKDSSPTDAGGSVPYAICFRSYADDAAGARHFLEILTVKRPAVRRALGTGSAVRVAEAMYDSHYFEGFGKTREARIQGYAKGIERNARAVASALGEPLAVTAAPPSGSPPAAGLSPATLVVVGAAFALGLVVLSTARPRLAHHPIALVVERGRKPFMTDQSIQTWIAQHQIVTHTGALLALVGLAGLLRPRTPEEETAFAAAHPHLAELAELARVGFGIDQAAVKQLIVTIWTAKLLPKLPLDPTTPPALPRAGAPALPAGAAPQRA
jgi:hypothetical protein